MYINFPWNCKVCVGVAFLCLLCAFLPNLKTLEWIDQQHCENKDEVHFFTLKTECHNRYNKLLLCNFLNMVTLHDTIKTIQNGVFVLFKKKNENLFLFKGNKKTHLKKTGGLFLKKRVFLNPDYLSILFCNFPWNKSRHYQFDWVCAAHL